jgi:pimeloyl-ACP methyl ester carboxylesterase
MGPAADRASMSTGTDAGSPAVDSPDGVRTETIAVEGDPLTYLRAGDDGPALVVLHGGIIDAAHISWGPQLDSLAGEARIYAPHLPGYGPNPMPDEPLTIGSHVDAIGGFLEALDLEEVVVAGTSMGGGIAVGLGLDHPERLRGVVALDAMALGSQLSSGRLTWLLAKLRATNRLSVALMRRNRSYVRMGLAALAHEDYVVPTELIDLVQAEARRPGAGAAFRQFRANEVTWRGYRTDYTDRLHELSLPTVLGHGDADDVIPLGWSERAADLLPHAQLHVFEDCGHLPTWERQDAVDDLVSRFL